MSWVRSELVVILLSTKYSPLISCEHHPGQLWAVRGSSAEFADMLRDSMSVSLR